MVDPNTPNSEQRRFLEEARAHIYEKEYSHGYDWHTNARLESVDRIADEHRQKGLGVLVHDTAIWLFDGKIKIDKTAKAILLRAAYK